MAMTRSFLSKIRPLISSSFPKSHTFCSSSSATTTKTPYFFPYFPLVEVSKHFPPTLLSEAKAAAKAWDAKTQLVRNSAGVNLTEANLHFSAYQARIHAGESPDSAATVAKLSKAEAFMEAANARFAEAEDLIAEGEARVAEGKARIAELKVQMREVKEELEAFTEVLDEKKSHVAELEEIKSKQAKRGFELYDAAIKAGEAPDSAVVKKIVLEAEQIIAASEEVIGPIKARMKKEEASIVESKAQMVELEVRAGEFEALIAVVEAGLVDFKAGVAEMQEQASSAKLVAEAVARCARNHIAEKVKQTVEYEAKIAEMEKLGDVATKTGIWERARKFYLWACVS